MLSHPCCLTLGCARHTPESDYNALVEHSKAGDWAYVYDNCDTKGQAKLDIFSGIMQKMIEVNPLKSPDAAKISALKGKDLYVAVMQTVPPMIGGDFKSVTVDGNKATVITTGLTGLTTREMTYENGVWKMSF